MSKYNFSINELLRYCSIVERNQLFSNNELSCNFIELAYFVIHLRRYIGLPLIINSTYRSLSHNQKTSGSSSTSQHLVSAAFDIACSDMSALINGIKTLNSKLQILGQVIVYRKRGFIHIALKSIKYPVCTISYNDSKT